MYFHFDSMNKQDVYKRQINAIAIIIVVYVVLYVLFKKNRYTFVDWMENQAAKYQL